MATVLITGTSTGIGLATALACARGGHDVWATMRDPVRAPQLQTLANSFLAALTSGGVPMVILHNPGKTVPGAPNTVTSLSVDRLIATQRRRLGR